MSSVSGGTWTPDQLLRRQMLYPTELLRHEVGSYRRHSWTYWREVPQLISQPLYHTSDKLDCQGGQGGIWTPVGRASGFTVHLH